MGKSRAVCSLRPHVTNIADLVVEALPLKDTHNGINRISLVLLYFEIKLHELAPLGIG